jgi:SAM-dependent methyltransferase
VSERLSWAAETLAVGPADRVLEIGCGNGGAAALVAGRLVSGRILAIDRSATMIAAAERRQVGRAEFRTVSFERADFGDARFDKVFSVNVSMFWKPPGDAVGAVRELLAPGGLLYVFHQPPVAAKNHEVSAKATALLQQQGFTVRDLLAKDMEPAPCVCIIAELA